MKNLKDTNVDYRKALNACRVCRTCAETPEKCPLDTFLGQFEKAHAAAAEHAEDHGC